jgi:predicted nucleic acid-binding protein
VTVVDSDVLIRILRGQKEAADKLRLAAQTDVVGCSVITTYEVLKGCTPLQEPATERLLAGLIQLPVTEAISRAAAAHAQALLRQNVRLSLPDLLVACTALEHQAPVLTGNTKHFLLPGLVVIQA